MGNKPLFLLSKGYHVIHCFTPVCSYQYELGWMFIYLSPGIVNNILAHGSHLSCLVQKVTLLSSLKFPGKQIHFSFNLTDMSENNSFIWLYCLRSVKLFTFSLDFQAILYNRYPSFSAYIQLILFSINHLSFYSQINIRIFLERKGKIWLQAYMEQFQHFYALCISLAVNLLWQRFCVSKNPVL